MEDNFEKYVRNHRDEFDDLTPGDHVWEQISEQTKEGKTINWSKILWRAAAVALIFTASFFTNEAWHQYRSNEIAQEKASDKFHEIQIPELLEAEAYYTSKFEDRMKEVKNYSVNYPEVENEMQVEMAELDKAFEELRADLKDDIDNKEIVEAMIQNYRIKVKMLEEIISHIKSQETNPNEDETIEYNL